MKKEASRGKEAAMMGGPRWDSCLHRVICGTCLANGALVRM